MKSESELNHMKHAGYFIQFTVYSVIWGIDGIEVGITPQDMWIKKSDIVAFTDDRVFTQGGWIFVLKKPKN